MIISKTKFGASIQKIFLKNEVFFENFNLEETCGTLPHSPLGARPLILALFLYLVHEDSFNDFLKAN